MSCSNSPHVIIPDDDNEEEGDDSFDWEAAVREIDVACQRSNFPAPSPVASTSSRHQANAFALNSKKPSVSRQSTLDRFVLPTGNHQRVVNVCNDEIGDGERGYYDDKENYDNINNSFPSCYCKIDLDAAKTWLYPVNIPLREYQLSITKTALFANTLVALPTGLGKTLIAAVVMYNYFRWFPEGKIVFTAPSRPLVMQQIEACHNTVGIPQEWTTDMTGQTSPSKRVSLWKDKRVFFVTPQVLEKDIQSGTCLMKHLVCLVIDEAHRAQGNYSYCVAVRELLAVPLQFRILALTATPGSKQETIQNVIDNLLISKLEYRTESDHDISSYVQNRKLELIRVAMGKDAMEIYDLLLEAIRAIVAKLSSFGVLLNRDINTLSALDLLTTRDKFRQAPPPNLPPMKCGEVEGHFGALIALYHMRKLLSAHGIKPTYEMLEEKLRDGSFARYMSKNEVIWNAKRLMQQNLSHGAPNPKLVKMMDILIDHFKRNDPKNSRVIIFSNFRGSVRDIMNSLSSMGESVKATEFIGQSSGKSLKGQTQKIQQAVLQKFRAGGYNIIVATSIGEEGLDIMEVDLVICFDANVSPLRMIQRMGRTGRKNDGRVVVLACEGPEIKGYMRKQASGKVVNRHMRNGGMNSFKFHPSPRMVPHICKPEVQFVEFSIEQFVPRGKKVKDDSVRDSTYTDKLSDAEAELITKYFCPYDEFTWKPSLIAFPHFQAFPSRVHNVMHSVRTRMLIGTMQQLQTLSFSLENVNLPVEDDSSSYQCLAAEGLPQDDRSKNGAHLEEKVPEVEAFDAVISSCTEEHCILDSLKQNVSRHCFLFEAVYVSVEPSGNVSIASVPSLPFVKEAPVNKSNAENSTRSRASARDNYEFSERSNGNVANPAQSNQIPNSLLFSSWLQRSSDFKEPVLHEVENVVSTPSPERRCTNSEVVIVTPDSTRRDHPILFAKESTIDDKDIEMSPRLTNMVEEGVVPESPLGEIAGHSSNGHKVCSSPEPVYFGPVANCSGEEHSGKIPKDNMLHSVELTKCELRKQSHSSVHVPFAFCSGPLNVLRAEKAADVNNCNSVGASGCVFTSPTSVKTHGPPVTMQSCDSPMTSTINMGARTPLVNLTNSCSNDWRLSSGEPSKSTQQAPKFKRLRKLGESNKNISSKVNITDLTLNSRRSTTELKPMKHIKGKRKMMNQAKAFFEVEAEVSSDAEVSDDEEEDNDNNSNDDSFIDDRINPTLEGTQAEAIRSNMMAIYRRSLLSQSPMESPSCHSSDFNTSIMQCRTETDEAGSSSSGKVIHSLQTPQTDLRSGDQSAVRSSKFCHLDSGEIPQVNMPSATSAAAREERKMESRKRKLSFHQVGYDPETSIQPKRLFHSEVAGQTPLHCQPENTEPNGSAFCDDEFYEGLDLDALEEQATKLLRCKSQISHIPDPLTKKDSDQFYEGLDLDALEEQATMLLGCKSQLSHIPKKGSELSHTPSFDLGI